ncbi:hypothetical protein F4561_006250 [Lipingzhangella halophila]|uniref:Uncharacterized protein n=1 Tax=Lipingzhangella halophila TaxID=1783352 RepID=A0A7W7W646_9ACTN|nr:hypothetical protein [Lipingzhangella halophila]
MSGSGVPNHLTFVTVCLSESSLGFFESRTAESEVKSATSTQLFELGAL